MAGSSAKGRSGARRVLAGIAILGVLLFAGLTAGWFYLAGELDARVEAAIEAAGGDGVSIGCVDRAVFGYPFRIGLSCASVTIEAPERALTASGGSLRTAAQIYDPGRIVAELASPVSVAAPDLPPLDLHWTLGQASARFSVDGLTQLSVALDAPSVALRSGEGAAAAEFARSDRLEIHARRNAGDLDLALDDRAVVVTPPGVTALPAFDLSANLSVAGAAPWLSGGLPGGRLDAALRGQAGTVRSLRLALPGGGAAEASGPFSISSEGEISGDFTLALEDPEAIAGLVGRLVPGSGSVASTLVGALGFVGRQEEGRTVVDIAVRDGRAQLGFIPLGRIPPI